MLMLRIIVRVLAGNHLPVTVYIILMLRIIVRILVGNHLPVTVNIKSCLEWII